MIKVVHMADLHIRPKDIEEIKRCLQFIISTAQIEKPDLAVVAADIFDDREVKVDSETAITAIGFVSALADICPIAIITGTVSHDGGAPRIMGYARGKYDIRVSDRPEQFYFRQGAFYSQMVGNLKPDAVLTMIPTITKQYFKTSSGIAVADQEIGQAMTGIFAGFGATAVEWSCPHIVVGHWNISGARLPSSHVRTGMDIEVSTDQIRLAGGDHDFLGAFYPGPIYPVKVDEQECGFWIHELDGRDLITCVGHIHQVQQLGGSPGTFPSRHIATPFTRTVRRQFDLTAGEEIALPAEELAGCIARVEIKAWSDEAAKIDQQAMKDALLRWGATEAIVKVMSIPREVVRSAEVLDAPTLRLKIIEQAKIKGEEVDPGILELADRLEGALAEVLLQQARGGAV